MTYIFDFICKNIWNIPYAITSHVADFERSSGIKINYSTENLKDRTVSITPLGYLGNTNIQFSATLLDLILQAPLKKERFNSDVDYLSIIFFMLSRHEEYLDFEPDAHGRFSASSSRLSRHDIPIVDVCVEILRQALNETFSHLPPIPAPRSGVQCTYDIDHARAYLWKGRKRLMGGLLKAVSQGKFQEAWSRCLVPLGMQSDPYDIFDFLQEVHQQQPTPPIFFWLLGKYGKYDKNPKPNHPDFQALIQGISKDYEIGIHPSYGSYLNKEQLQREIHTLEKITGKRVTKSRFHFLKYKLPESYRMILDVGIEADFSMAFPDTLGYRAGTSYAFPWYDLEREVPTSLMLHPFSIMDVTLKNYLSLTPEEALKQCQHIAQQTTMYGGTLTHLWHNSSFDDMWKGWEKVHEYLLRLGRPLDDNA